ncbi:MAG: Gfo/Idh/MocA family oxidoreductase [Deltaproteobacteria bacterium]|nr:Gfo/Idh/MocA family oxidoreductase [Deltaproteobacteria bacterium]
MSLRVVVIGVGHLGRFHAQKIRALSPLCDLAGIVEPSTARREEMVREFGCPSFARLEDVPAADAAIIAAPTIHHFALSKACLERGWHILVEKPVVRTVEEGRSLVALAEQHPKLIVTVGQIERFNPAVLAAERFGDKPWYIVGERLGPFKERSTDVDVIDDLMIHDLDLCLRWVRSEPADIRAVGVSIFTELVDMANARIEFQNGAVCSLTASRSSLESTRKLRLFTASRYLSLDLGQKAVKSVRRHPPKDGSAWPEIEMEPVDVVPSDALLEENRAFLQACLGNGPNLVPLEEAVATVELAEKVKRALKTPGIPRT